MPQKLKTAVTAQKPKPLVTPTLAKPLPLKQELEDDQTRQRIAAILQPSRRRGGSQQKQEEVGQ